jgi:hypothetical protein
VRSPVAVGIVLGLVVGAGATVAIASTTSSGKRAAPAPEAALHSTPTNRGEAPEYRLRSDPAPGSVERLAAAFDVHGPVQTDAGGWFVRESNRLVRVQRAAGLPWFFSTMGGQCKLVPETLATLPPSGPEECPDVGAPAAPPGEVLSQDDALALGTETLARAGLGPSTTDIVDQPGGWYIQASPQIDGKPTDGLQWTISIGPGRTVTAASGYLAVEDR